MLLVHVLVIETTKKATAFYVLILSVPYEHCRVYLCILKEGNETKCFKKFHTKPNLFVKAAEVMEDASESADEV